MRIHHLNCGSLCPLGGHFMDGFTPGVGEAKLVCHCLLIESEKGLILIDTGLGTNDIHETAERVSPFFKNLLRPKLLLQETALAQIVNLGFNPSDVRHIVLTHLDFDHAGGIDDFPRARVHLMETERRAISKRNSFISKNRYSPAQLTQSKHWTGYYPEGERWFGFQSVRDLEGLPPEILLIPLYGHTEGHAGVAIHTDQGWLLHAGDAYFYRGEMDPHYHCSPGLRGYQKMMEYNRKQRLENQKRLRMLAEMHKEDVTVFSGHDSVEYLSLKEGPIRKLVSADQFTIKGSLGQHESLNS